MNTSLTRRGLVAITVGLAAVSAGATAAHGGSDPAYAPPEQGSTIPDDTAMTEDTAPPSTIDPAQLAGAVVGVAESAEFGLYLVDGEGMSLYAFLNDTDGESTCTGDCLANWPALTFDADEFAEGDLAPILDPELFTTVENAEAGQMVKAGDWPLYHFAGDEAAGDTNGQGVGDVWYLMRPDGSLIDGSAIRVAESDEHGEYLIDAEGRSLYGFLNDTDGESTCVDDCALNWPPLLIEGDLKVATGLDAELFSVVDHPQGGQIAKAGDWPLYYFAGDESPGDTNGHGVGDVWFLVAPDGSAISTE